MTQTQHRELVDRFYIAALLDCSHSSVRRNEKALGIDAAKVNLNKRLVRYKLRMVLRILKAKGYLE